MTGSAARAAIAAVAEAATHAGDRHVTIADPTADPAESSAADLAAARAVVAGLGRPPGPTDLGRVYEALLPSAARAAGAHYTDPMLARALVDVAAPADWLAAAPRRVWDPACGGGAFLLAAADALIAAGHRPEVIVTELLHGTDLDPGAIAVTRAALSWWSRRHGADAVPRDHLLEADALLDGSDATRASERVDLVVGNPPFQSQMTGPTRRDRDELAALRSQLGDVVAPYTDTAALFLVVGVRALAVGGRCCLVLPLSTLAARDAAPAREAVESLAAMTGLWVAGEAVFDADVEVCAPVLERCARPTTGAVAVRRWSGRSVAALADSAPPDDNVDRVRISQVVAAGGRARWAVHALGALDVPDPAIAHDGVLGDLVRTTAGFRDEYYGLIGHVVEAPAGLDGIDPGDDAWPDHLAALVTSGAIDPSRHRWGEREIRFARTRFRRPVLDRRAFDGTGRAAAWVRTTAAPKVVIATQTKVGEAAVDERGTLLASTPVVVALAAPDRLWEVAAVVCSPVGSVAALAGTAGTGRSAQAVRHTTASVAGLPLPVDAMAWRSGSSSLRSGDRERFVDAMAAAYALAPADAARLAEWWSARAPWPSPPHRP